MAGEAFVTGWGVFLPNAPVDNAHIEDVLGSIDAGSAPWEAGLPDMSRFRPSLWNSCGARPCKRW